MAYLCVGVDHEHVALDLLERVAVPEEKWSKVLGSLLANPNIDEVVFVSTCLRTEIYASIDRFHGAVEEITATLADVTGVPVTDLTDQLTIHFDRGVAAHLFDVAAGLRSAVPGEYEVLGQLRRALEHAEAEHAAGPELVELFRRALGAGRRVRHETAIARGTTSFAHATVALAEQVLGEQLRGAAVVVVGAGQLASGVVKCLRDSSSGVGAIAVVNRTRANAETVRDNADDPRVGVVEFDSLAAVARDARLVIAALESPSLVLTRDDLVDVPHDVLVIDLGMPRVVDVGLDDLDGVQRLDISDLREVVQRSLRDRHEALDAAANIIAAEVARFHDDQRSRGAAAIVAELRERLDSLRRHELDRRASDVANWTEEQRAYLDEVTRAVVAKIAHAPTVALKDAAGTDRGHRLTETTRALFDL